jgi:hypothetical protein
MTEPNVPQKPSVYIHEDTPLLQESVYQLELYKRRLGRNFDKATNHHDRVWFFNRYNNVENTIQMLCDKYKLQRKYAPHKLDINKV